MNVLLAGGGLDSTALMVYLRDLGDMKPRCLWVNYGQKAAMSEYKSVNYFGHKYNYDIVTVHADLDRLAKSTILLGTPIGNRSQNCLELRNLFLISYAAIWCASDGGGCIYVGFHKEPDGSFPDANADWLDSVMGTLNSGTKSPMKVLAPFRGLTRYEIFSWAAAHDHEIIDRSYTCYEGSECGKCVHCVEKRNMTERLATERGPK